MKKTITKLNKYRCFIAEAFKQWYYWKHVGFPEKDSFVVGMILLCTIIKQCSDLLLGKSLKSWCFSCSAWSALLVYWACHSSEGNLLRRKCLDSAIHHHPFSPPIYTIETPSHKKAEGAGPNTSCATWLDRSTNYRRESDCHKSVNGPGETCGGTDFRMGGASRSYRVLAPPQRDRRAGMGT